MAADDLGEQVEEFGFDVPGPSVLHRRGLNQAEVPISTNGALPILPDEDVASFEFADLSIDGVRRRDVK